MGYLLELVDEEGNTLGTRHEWKWWTGTYNQVILRAFIEALSRMKEKCEIHFHTHNHFIVSLISRSTLDSWKKSDFKNSRGKEIANADLWRVFAQAVEGHQIIGEEGISSYYKWMQSQLKSSQTQ